MSEPIDLDAIQARADVAYAEVAALCQGKRWTMQIPARPDKDSDLVIAAALSDIPALHLEVQLLRAEIERLRAEATRAANERLNARDSGGLTVCHNLGCMVVFHATDKCPACNDEPANPRPGTVRLTDLDADALQAIAAAGRVWGRS